MKLDTDFVTTTIELAPDYEGEVVATLIASRLNTGSRKSVLYVHGYIDYFFHPHMCEKFHEHGFDFYAVDLRKYGRSLLPHQKPNYCEDASEYYEEITASIKAIQSNSSDDIYLLGHSTGGLIASCYMNCGEKKNDIKALVLNSPFLDMREPFIVTKMNYGLAEFVSVIKKDCKRDKAISPVYAESIHKDYHGEWDFNLAWKPINGFPAYFKWFVAIVDAQRSLKKSHIKVPILLLHSSKSFEPKKYSPKAKQADIVLDIEDMKRIGPNLGNKVQLISIDNGQHDLFLSAKEVRERAFEEMFSWLKPQE